MQKKYDELKALIVNNLNIFPRPLLNSRDFAQYASKVTGVNWTMLNWPHFRLSSLFTIPLYRTQVFIAWNCKIIYAFE